MIHVEYYITSDSILFTCSRAKERKMLEKIDQAILLSRPQQLADRALQDVYDSDFVRTIHYQEDKVFCTLRITFPGMNNGFSLIDVMRHLGKTEDVLDEEQKFSSEKYIPLHIAQTMEKHVKRYAVKTLAELEKLSRFIVSESFYNTDIHFYIDLQKENYHPGVRIYLAAFEYFLLEAILSEKFSDALIELCLNDSFDFLVSGMSPAVALCIQYYFQLNQRIFQLERLIALEKVEEEELAVENLDLLITLIQNKNDFVLPNMPLIITANEEDYLQQQMPSNLPFLSAILEFEQSSLFVDFSPRFRCFPDYQKVFAAKLKQIQALEKKFKQEQAKTNQYQYLNTLLFEQKQQLVQPLKERSQLAKLSILGPFFNANRNQSQQNDLRRVASDDFLKRKNAAQMDAAQDAQKENIYDGMRPRRPLSGSY